MDKVPQRAVHAVNRDAAFGTRTHHGPIRQKVQDAGSSGLLVEQHHGTMRWPGRPRRQVSNTSSCNHLSKERGPRSKVHDP